jgi:hypothetical protein
VESNHDPGPLPGPPYPEAHAYLSYLQDNWNADWWDLYSSVTELSIPQKFALIHPHFYELDLGQGPSQAKCKIRGSRTPSLKGPKGRCTSHELWGYQCPYGDAVEIQLEHKFPWSRGGPSRAANFAWLCEKHNALKGADIHQLRFDEGQFPWLSETLDAIRVAKS